MLASIILEDLCHFLSIIAHLALKYILQLSYSDHLIEHNSVLKQNSIYI